MLQRFGLRRMMAGAPGRALRGLAILVAAALTLGAPAPSGAIAPVHPAEVLTAPAPDQLSAATHLDDLRRPQDLRSAKVRALAPPAEGSGADSAAPALAHVAWLLPTATPLRPAPVADGARTVLPSAYESRGPPLSV